LVATPAAIAELTDAEQPRAAVQVKAVALHGAAADFFMHA
jgi:hypothetical protein